MAHKALKQQKTALEQYETWVMCVGEVRHRVSYLGCL